MTDTGEVEFDVSEPMDPATADDPNKSRIAESEKILAVLKEHGELLKELTANYTLLRNDQLVMWQECSAIMQSISQLECKQPRRPASSELCKVVNDD